MYSSINWHCRPLSVPLGPSLLFTFTVGLLASAYTRCVAMLVLHALQPKTSRLLPENLKSLEIFRPLRNSCIVGDAVKLARSSRQFTFTTAHGADSRSEIAAMNTPQRRQITKSAVRVPKR